MIAIKEVFVMRKRHKLCFLNFIKHVFSYNVIYDFIKKTISIFSFHVIFYFIKKTIFQFMEKNGQYNSDIIFKINIYYDFCNRGEWLWVRGVGGG